MRVALVCGHFMPEVGYQEVWIAQTLARLGIAVRVVTSTAVSSSARRIRRFPYPAGIEERPEGYEVLRLPVRFRFRSAVISAGLVEAVAEWRPDVIVLIGIGKLFGAPVLQSAALQSIPIVCFLSELAEYRQRHSLVARSIAWLQDRGFELVKREIYRQAIHRAQLLVCNSPGTLEWLQSYCCRTHEDRSAVNAKARVLTLGYDSSLFFFQAEERAVVRRHLECGEDVIALTVTRVVPHKGLERIIDAVGELQRHGHRVRYLLVGALGDKYEEMLRRRIEAQPRPHHFYVFPFQPPEQTRRFAAAADVGIWMQIAISATEALGTGLPLLLPRRHSLSHLVRDGINGWYWEEPHGFENSLEIIVQRLLKLPEESRCQWRQALAAENRGRFSYEAIVGQVLREVGFSVLCPGTCGGTLLP